VNYPEAIAASGDYLYVTHFSSNVLHVYDISSPLSPVLMSSTAINPQPYSIDVNDGYAYIPSYSNNQLQIFDVSNPASPSLTGVVSTSVDPLDISVSVDFAYIVCQTSNQLRVVDLTDKTAPVVAQSISTDTTPSAVVASGNYVYTIGTGGDSLQSFFFSGNVIAPQTVALSAIVESECLKSDLLTVSDIDVTELTDQVRGYRVSSLAPLRGGIDPLRKAWPFDAIQHGYQIKFKKRGGASVATITEGELDAREAGAAPGVQITNVREMDLILPQQLTAKYIDAVREYDLNVAEESRQ